MNSEAGFANLTNMLLHSSRSDGGITFIESEDNEDFLSYRELYNKALYVLTNLQKHGLKAGDEAVFQFQHNRSFIITFWACILGKIIPVPITFGSSDEVLLKLVNIWKLLNHPFLVTDYDNFKEMIDPSGHGEDLETVSSIRERIIYFADAQVIYKKAEPVPAELDDIAFIQYSSGSTGEPKGVINTHKSIIYNVYYMTEFFKINAADKILSWMPLTHDMGLIFFHILPLYNGIRQYLIPPIVFLTYPALWMSKASDHHITISGSPNFGYKYYLDHFDEKTMQGRSLEQLKLIVNSAEPISFDICDRFSRTLGKFKLDRRVIRPSYGLAEATLGVSSVPLSDEFSEHLVHRDHLQVGDQVRFLDTRDDHAVSFVDLGIFTFTSIIITDEAGGELPEKTIGYIRLKGPCITRGYYNDTATTDRLISKDGWLNTGDLGFLSNQRLVIVGRAKELIIINGQNYYPLDLERIAEGVPGIKPGGIAVTSVFNSKMQTEQVLCFVVFRSDTGDLREFVSVANNLRRHVIDKIGIEFHHILPIDKIPVTTSGKIQRYKLKERYLNGEFAGVSGEINSLRQQMKMIKRDLPRQDVQKIVVEICKEILKLKEINIHDNFFDLGGSSSYAMQVRAKLEVALGVELDDIALFKYPTIHALVDYLTPGESSETLVDAKKEWLKIFKTNRSSSWERIKKNLIKEPGKNHGRNGLEIAMVGISGRFPGAKNHNQLWSNLIKGIDSISFFSDHELNQRGVDTRILNNSNYIKAKGVLEDVDYFDAAFFGYTPLESQKMDPQTRLLHECIWETLEDAAYDPGTFEGLIGVYVGASPNHFWDSQPLLAGRTSASEQISDIHLIDKDFMATRVSYKLKLKGPSITLYTACSTSLVAIDLACQGLLNGKCDMALAGGVSIWLPHKTGYLYEEEMLFSRDGHNRAFDAQGSGTIFSDGAAIIALKRLEDALAHRDHIYAVIKASAVNNDGDRKAGYTAPALEGQAEVIAAAQQMAEVEPESINYLEAHGTATTLGDPIEIDALKLAFNTSKKGYCALGSIKSNIGHINAAAGAAGLIKAALSLKYRLIPPSIHFENANPRIDFDNSPFYVNTQLKEWKTGTYPRRAGVSSFGIGGTNAHVIIEEAPEIEKSSHERKWKLLIFSANTPEALDNTTRELVGYLKENPGINLSDVAYTLHVGRRYFQHRRMLACTTAKEAIDALLPAKAETSPLPPEAVKVLSSFVENDIVNRPVILMFSGLGSQYLNMGLELYREEPVFRQEMDYCFEIGKSLLGKDLRCVLYPSESSQNTGLELEAADKLKQTEFLQPITFIFGYALAKLLIKWGITPQSLIGYSFGEYIAACIAGVFSLEDALKLVISRAQLVGETLEGTMLSVPLSKEKLEPLLDQRLSLAVDNGPSCIVAGSKELIDTFEQRMKANKLMCLRVQTDHAVHSILMEPILEAFESHVKKVQLKQPQVPYISNVSGTWITSQEATDPRYWVKQLRSTVRFAEGIQKLLTKENAIFIEVGPGVAVSTIVRQFTRQESKHVVMNLIQHPQGNESDVGYLLNKIGRLWLYGVNIHWPEFYSMEKRYRIPLPSSPFDRQFYPIEDNSSSFKSNNQRDPGQTASGKNPDISDWFYIPLWKQSIPISPIPSHSKETSGKSVKMVFIEENGFGSRLLKQWRVEEDNVIAVRPGAAFMKEEENLYCLNPRESADYETLFQELHDMGRLPETIVHLWSLNSKTYDITELERFHEAQELGLYSLIHIAHALENINNNEKSIQLIVVTSGIHNVTGEDPLEPEKITVLAPIITINQEYTAIRCRNLDITSPPQEESQEKKLIRQLLREFKQESADVITAYRNGYRWKRILEAVKLEEPEEIKENPVAAKVPPSLRKNGVYLITGGLGGIGFILAKDLAQRVGARLVITGRTVLPPKKQWDQWLCEHKPDDPISQKLNKALELERLGADVLVFSADTADKEKMEQLIEISEKQLGPINGVIHAAGIIGEQSIRAITEMDKADCEIQFQAKIYGLLTLEKIFRDKELDFCMLMSSISSFLGGLGLTAYAAANLFMDAFVAKNNRSNPCSWLSVNWDIWQPNEEKEQNEFLNRSLGELSMKPEEGIAAFYRCLSWNNSPQLVVSTGNLPLRLKQWVTIKQHIPPKEKSPSQGISATPLRRNILSTYAAPRNQVESIMTEIIQEFLGIEQIGIHDNFFELGATSLELIQINNRLNETLAVKVPLVKLLTYTSIASFADFFMKEIMGKQSATTKPINRSDAMRKGKESLKQKQKKRENRRFN